MAKSDGELGDFLMENLVLKEKYSIFAQTKVFNDMGKIKHNLNESYLQTLTEEERIRQMSEWTPAEWKQYHCPNGTVTLEEFRAAIYKRVDELILEKYGSEYID